MLFTRISLCKSLFLLFLLPIILFATSGKSEGAPKNFFPVFPAIKNNVIFWENIYSTYSVNTAVVHDKIDLSIVYDTIPLVNRNLPGASRLNRAYLKKVKKQYRSILESLARGKKPASSTEKKISSLFSPPNLKRKFKQAAENIRIQTGLKEQFIEGVIRSGSYITEMKNIFRSQGLPEDLAYLPHVESSFNLKAYSKYGAAGVWQFTRSTGKEFMRIDYIIDERRDPFIATRAAALYLKRNFQNLGTWPLAITAYNYGHSGMRRAVEQEKTYEKIFINYNKGYFKFASRNFYSEFIAACTVAKKLEKSNSITLETPKDSFHTRLRGFMHVNDLLNYYNINLATLRAFNPSLRSPVLQGEKYLPKDFQLRLPYSPKTILLATRVPDNLFHKNQKRSHFYTVKRGDTAGTIARRHNVSLKNLSQANNLNKNSVIYIGQTLRIPPVAGSKMTASNTSKATTGPQSVSAIVELKGGKKFSPAWQDISAQHIPVSYDTAVHGIHSIKGVVHGKITVQPEESLGIYAEWLKISKNRLLQINKLKGKASIHPGQTIVVAFQTVSRQKFEEQRKEFHQETEEDFFTSYKVTGFHSYQVAMGDTLWEICQKKFDLPLWLLKKYNSNLNYKKLDSRQQLKIPIIEAL